MPQREHSLDQRQPRLLSFSLFSSSVLALLFHSPLPLDFLLCLFYLPVYRCYLPRLDCNVFSSRRSESRGVVRGLRGKLSEVTSCVSRRQILSARLFPNTY